MFRSVSGIGLQKKLVPDIPERKKENWNLRLRLIENLDLSKKTMNPLYKDSTNVTMPNRDLGHKIEPKSTGNSHVSQSIDNSIGLQPSSQQQQVFVP